MKLRDKNILRVILFVVLGALPWYGITAISQLFMLIPLLLIQRDLKGEGVMKWWISAIVIWNIASIWWVGKATILGPIAATLVTTVLYTIVLGIYNKIWKKGTLSLAYTVLVAGWLAVEWIYLYNNEISFPWLNLGNSFGIEPFFVQWYEYTGILGGSLWILIVNLLIFEAVKNRPISFKGIFENNKAKAALLLIVIPVLISIVRYNTYENDGNEVNVAVLQPNVDPYTEKFSNSQYEQEKIMINLASKIEKGKADFIIAPETALDNDFIVNEGDVTNVFKVEGIRQFLYKNQFNADFITGVVARQYYSKNKYDKAPTITARTNDELSFYYDTYNAALSIDLQEIEMYFKSRLTIGVEMTPFYKYTRHLGDLFVNLGGAFGMLASQEERTVFLNKHSDIKAGTAICYESVYGEFFSEFIKKGADVMFVITNDGWWGDTPGYRQHLSFSSLRAIETRRDIARSANTGISAIIDSRGEILEKTKWDERTIIDSTVKSNSDITFYVKYGDYIGRIASFVFVLSVLYFIAYSYKKRNHLIK